MYIEVGEEAASSCSSSNNQLQITNNSSLSASHGDPFALAVNLTSKRSGGRKLDPKPLQDRLRLVGIGGHAGSYLRVLMFGE